MEKEKKSTKAFSKPRRWPTDTLWGTGYKPEILSCSCESCLRASTAKKHGKAKGAGR